MTTENVITEDLPPQTRLERVDALHGVKVPRVQVSVNLPATDETVPQEVLEKMVVNGEKNLPVNPKATY